MIRALDVMLLMFIVVVSCMHADDLVLVSASVSLLQRMIDTCCEEAEYLDIKFNALNQILFAMVQDVLI